MREINKYTFSDINWWNIKHLLFIARVFLCQHDFKVFAIEPKRLPSGQADWVNNKIWQSCKKCGVQKYVSIS